MNHTGAVGRDYAWGRDALRAIRQPKVEVVDRGGANGDGNRTGPGGGARDLAYPDPGGTDRLLEDSRTTLAQNADVLLENYRPEVKWRLGIGKVRAGAPT